MQSNRQIELGDIVQLAAGGPEMQVHSVQRDAVRCIWDEQGAKNFGYFRLYLLKRLSSATGAVE